MCCFSSWSGSCYYCCEEENPHGGICLNDSKKSLESIEVDDTQSVVRIVIDNVVC